jgi:hypothetical protein
MATYEYFLDVNHAIYKYPPDSWHQPRRVLCQSHGDERINVLCTDFNIFQSNLRAQRLTGAFKGRL